MSRNKLLALVTAVSLSASLYACGSDDGDPNGSNAGAAGASAGKGGNSGKAGSNGSAGKGASSGTSNVAGETGDAAGAGGSGADNGASGAGGMAGDTGSGAGETGNGAAGEGGAGSVDTGQTLAEACTAVCDPAHSVATCSSALDACITQCSGYPDVVQQQADAHVFSAADALTLKNEYLAAVRCMATNLTNTNQYACTAVGTMAGPTASPVADTACETVLCKWTCDDGNFGTVSADADVYGRCPCT